MLDQPCYMQFLLETLTFGWIFKYALDGKGSNAIMLAGALMAVGAIAMLWVNPPDEVDESPIVPLGSKRSITVCALGSELNQPVGGALVLKAFVVASLHQPFRQSAVFAEAWQL